MTFGAVHIVCGQDTVTKPSGAHIHPNDDGYKVTAAAVDLRLLTITHNLGRHQ